MMKITAAAILAGAIFGPGTAFAQTYYDYGTYGNPAYGFQPHFEGRSSQQQDQDDYGRSGTRGRMGLGADPYHPEGPGNAVTPQIR